MEITGTFLSKLLENKPQLVTFNPGKVICSKKFVPDSIFLIKAGTARLLARDKSGDLATYAKLETGDLAGAASVLVGSPLEEVRASSVVTAYVIRENELINILQVCTTAYREYLSLASKSLILPLAEKAVSESIEALDCRDTYNSLLEGSLIYSSDDSASIKAYIDSNKNCGLYLFDNAELFDASQAYRDTNVLPAKLKEQVSGLPVPPPIILSNTTCLTNDSSPEQDNPSNDYQLSPSEYSIKSETGGFRLVRGTGVVDEILACFQMIAEILNIPIRRDSLEEILSRLNSSGSNLTINTCSQIGASLGLHVASSTIESHELERVQTPALIQIEDSFVIAYIRAGQFSLFSPSDGVFDRQKINSLLTSGCTIKVLTVDKTRHTPSNRFGFSWFLPALRTHRGALLQVLTASFVVQLFTLANPLLIQVIIDKVISQRSLDTLQVLGIALLAVTLLEGVLGGLKTFLFTETTNKMDQRLGSEVIDHLLRLPLAYFDKRSVGELSSRVAELEKIRKFLTGQALTTIIDATFSILYIVVMLLYSSLLTFVALSVLPIQILLTIFGAPLFRSQYRKAAEANASTQSHLVEVLTGIQTIKSQNIELKARSDWQSRYSHFINRSFEQTITGTTLSQVSQLFQKISQLLVLWIGAQLVLSGQLSLGQLIAFRIISGYVTQPLLRMSTLWQSVQELKVSFERLADVINREQESDLIDRQNIRMSTIEGDLTFDNVSFTFPGQASPVLKGINLEIAKGTFVAIVGQSGSGKSTLTKLISRLYEPTQGSVLIDGYDISKVELYSLRRQIGIVPQEPILFSGSVAENISIGTQDATNHQIIEAAQLSVSHDFIMKLESGYSTNVGERGSSLSGGQRQRVAIARTLIQKPRLLVLDEATSALDYETETKVCESLLNSFRQTTVMFVTHRLASIKNAGLIVMMHNGSIAELGTHSELMNMRGRYYALYQQQGVY